MIVSRGLGNNAMLSTSGLGKKSLLFIIKREVLNLSSSIYQSKTINSIINKILGIRSII